MTKPTITDQMRCSMHVLLFARAAARRVGSSGRRPALHRVATPRSSLDVAIGGAVRRPRCDRGRASRKDRVAMRRDPALLGRRDVLRGLGVGALVAVASPARLLAARRTASDVGSGGIFLATDELDTLRAVTARLLPGPPDDADAGALEAGCAEAIDALLGAFTFDPPLIHAGGPFSDRAGATHDDMA